MKLVSPDIEAYCGSHSTLPSAICQEIEAFTRSEVPYPQMLSGPLVGSFLGLMIGITGARRVLEVGTFTGYSALCMAERLPVGGELITLDKNPETQAIGRRFWDKSPHGVKIRNLNGDGSDLLAGLAGPFDFVFIDADKGGYLSYLQAVLPKLSPRAVVVADNCLWSGEVLNTKNPDIDTMALQQFNDWVATNRGLESSLLPIRDGLHVIRKKA